MAEITNDDIERYAVIALGQRIGFGRVMQLCEQLWGEIEGFRRGHLTVGPCDVFMVNCPHPENNRIAVECEWCCGSGRVPIRVLMAMPTTGEQKCC